MTRSIDIAPPLLDVIIPGTPTSQGSMISNRHGGMRYPTKTVGARNFAVEFLEANAVGAVVGLTGPVAVRVRFHFKRPGSHYLPANSLRSEPVLRANAPTWHAIEPDTDKCCRLVGDALQIAGIITDDKLIASWAAEKRWAHNGSTRIQLFTLEGINPA